MSSSATSELNHVLDRRASRYAVPMTEARSHAAEVLVFQRGARRFALDLTHLEALRPLRGACPVPGASSKVPGIFYWNGQLLSLHDIGAFVGEVVTAPRWVLVVEHQARSLGLLADEVEGVRRLDAPPDPPPVALPGAAELYRGLLADDTAVLKVDGLFHSKSFYLGDGR
ncbi:chemotaxis protein CheW [Myxococcota bacterium]|nr:chemotaxis protein CheW [Myxococcota bacterium]MBU1431388.1 chemotaxis protein CheW [Myxococcota bacterium]MBU1898395.1 chemotaxis protein CheW [Myxococcota bacterium]